MDVIQSSLTSRQAYLVYFRHCLFSKRSLECLQLVKTSLFYFEFEIRLYNSYSTLNFTLGFVLGQGFSLCPKSRTPSSAYLYIVSSYLSRFDFWVAICSSPLPTEFGRNIVNFFPKLTYISYKNGENCLLCSL